MKTVAMIGTVGTVGIVGSEAEEDEPAASHLEANFPFSETDVERERTFALLKEYKKQKRLEERIECLRQTSGAAKAEVKRMFAENTERFQKSQETVAVENAGVGIADVEDESGQLVKQRSARGTIPATRRPLSKEDRERIDGTRDRRHTHRWFEKRLLEIHEGRVKVSRVEYHAFVTFGRMRGWTRRPPVKR